MEKYSFKMMKYTILILNVYLNNYKLFEVQTLNSLLKNRKLNINLKDNVYSRIN